MLAITPIPFKQWTPDQPPPFAGCLEARNCVPAENGFRGARGPVPYGSSIGEAVTGSFWIKAASGLFRNFAATPTAIYEYDGATDSWADVSLSGGYNATGPWTFLKYGSRVIAVARNVVPQYLDVDSVQATFLDLPGAPVGAAAAVIRDQIVIADTDIDPTYGGGANFVRWSGVNNSERWVPSAQTQSDFNEIFGRGGAVQKIVPGPVGTIFQEHSIWRMTFAGPPITYRFDEIKIGFGTPAPRSVVWHGDLIYFFGWDGFYAMSRDGQLKNIGDQKINRWFRQNSAPNAFESIIGAVDRSNMLVLWAFKSSATLDYSDRILIYNILLDSWSYMDANTTHLDEILTAGLTLDQLDTVLPGGIDVYSFSIDSDVYLGGAMQVVGFNRTGQAYSLTGGAMTATLETAEWSGEEGRRAMVNAVRPLVERSQATPVAIQVGYREQTTDVVSYTSLEPLDFTGEAKFHVDAKHLRARLLISGAFSGAYGVEVEQRIRTGRR